MPKALSIILWTKPDRPDLRTEKLPLPAGIFGIHSPVISGLPAVLNHFIQIPFILIPMISIMAVNLQTDLVFCGRSFCHADFAGMAPRAAAVSGKTYQALRKVHCLYHCDLHQKRGKSPERITGKYTCSG